MKYLRFTYVDAVTGISVYDAPAANGVVFPHVNGLTYEWQRTSTMPTDRPDFFGTCPDDSVTQGVPGVLAEFGKYDFDIMHSNELRARVPHTVSMVSIRLALLAAGKLSAVSAAVQAAREELRISWEFATVMERHSASTLELQTVAGISDTDFDDLFTLGATL